MFIYLPSTSVSLVLVVPYIFDSFVTFVTLAFSELSLMGLVLDPFFVGLVI